MKKVKVRIEGILPGLLMHRYPLEKQEKKSTIKNRTQTEDDVESFLYLDDEGKLAQPAEHLIGALRKAGAKFQIPGQGKLTYKNIVSTGGVIINPDMIRHQNQKWEIDRRRVVIPKGGAVVRLRPLLKQWSLVFHIEFDEDEIPKSVLYDILVYAGKRVGIGDFRPSSPKNGGPFGKFIVTQFEELD